MKILLLLSILITCTSCAPSYNNRPIQDQVVGGTSILDALTGRDRVGILAKQAHYDIFISKAIPSSKWYANVPLLNLAARPDGYEICAAPSADAMASVASSLASAFSVKGKTGSPNSPEVALAGSLADSFASKLKAFSIRTQGLQYMRDVRFNNCMIWQNRGQLGEIEEKYLREELLTANIEAANIGKELILKELMLRAATNNFGVSSVEMTKEDVIELQKQTKSNLEQLEKLMAKIMVKNKDDLSMGIPKITNPTTKAPK